MWVSLGTKTEATITHTKQEITTIYEINIYMNPGNLAVDEPLC